MPNACGTCWAEFTGWLKAFTPLETLLTIIEAIFLILFIVFLDFLILHFLVCGNDINNGNVTTPPFVTNATSYHNGTTWNRITTPRTRPTCTYTRDQTSVTTQVTITTSGNNSNAYTPTQPNTNMTSHYVYDTDPMDAAELQATDLSDGVVADDDEKQFLLALVKVKPSGLTFGCILTVLDEHWTITAASCIESIEEVDSLDNFVMLDNYGEAQKGRSHPISDVRIHPSYQGNSTFDLALLKTDDALKRRPVALPSLLDYFRMPIGETAHILGFGNFRTIDQSSNGQQVHSASVHLLPSKHCQAQQLEERHLVPMTQLAHGRCGLGPMCLGVLYARGTPCNYCAGAPLLSARVLLGVMADNGQCGAACEPARYANIAAARDWLQSALAS